MRNHLVKFWNSLGAKELQPSMTHLDEDDLKPIQSPRNLVPPWDEQDGQFKTRMVDEGTWPKFLLERACYRFRGCPDKLANVLAQQHFPPPMFPVKAIRTSGSTSTCGLGPYGNTELKMRTRLMTQIGVGEFARADAFLGRTCTETIAMAWVAETLGVATTQKDAPSKFAWSVYEWASSHASNRRAFYMMYLPTRLPRVKDDEDESYDPAEGISAEHEDVGLESSNLQPSNLEPDNVGVSDQSVVSDSLPGDTDGPGRESEVAPEDELKRY